MTTARLFTLTLAAILGSSVTTARTPGSAAQRAAADTVAFAYDVDGVRVIQRINTSNDVVAVNVYLIGGAQQLTSATQGIEALYVEAAEWGTRNYPDPVIRRAWGETGSVYVSDADWDWTLVGFRGVRADFDSSWNILADRIARPTFSAAAITRARDQMIAGLRLRMTIPDGELSRIADSVAFAGHPYGLHVGGTEATLHAIDSAQLAAYVKNTVVQSRLLVVVVGNVTRAEVETAVQRTLATLPRGTFAWKLPDPAPARSSTPTIVHRVLPTNYIMAHINGPPLSSPEYPGYELAVGILASTISASVRERGGLSYLATASVSARGTTAGLLYATTTRPDTVIRIMRGKLDSVRFLYVSADNIDYFIERFKTSILSRTATNGDLASGLGRAQLLQGDFRQMGRTIDRYKDVRNPAIKSAAIKYLKDPKFTYLGDTARVSKDTFGKVK